MSEKTIAEKLTEIAESIPQIRQKAYADGYNNGLSATDAYDQGMEDGKQAEYDAFWDAYQENGTRENYSGAFKRWVEECFKPKYDIVPKKYYGSQLFQELRIEDLKGSLERQGVKLDLSENTSLLQMFQGSEVKYIPLIDARKADYNTGYAFSTNTIISIEKILVSEITIYGTNMFDCNKLETVIFEGVIGQNGLNLSKCTKLSHESLMSIINALKSGVSGLTCTLGSTNLAKLTDAEKAIATQKGWTLA